MYIHAGEIRAGDLIEIPEDILLHRDEIEDGGFLSDNLYLVLSAQPHKKDGFKLLCMGDELEHAWSGQVVNWNIKGFVKRKG